MAPIVKWSIMVSDISIQKISLHNLHKGFGVLGFWGPKPQNPWSDFEWLFYVLERQNKIFFIVITIIGGSSLLDIGSRSYLDWISAMCPDLGQECVFPFRWRPCHHRALRHNHLKRCSPILRLLHLRPDWPLFLAITYGQLTIKWSLIVLVAKFN